MNLFMYFKLWIFLTRQGSKKSMVLFKVIIIVYNFSIKHAYSQKKENYAHENFKNDANLKEDECFIEML